MTLITKGDPEIFSSAILNIIVYFPGFVDLYKICAFFVIFWHLNELKLVRALWHNHLGVQLLTLHYAMQLLLAVQKYLYLIFDHYMMNVKKIFSKVFIFTKSIMYMNLEKFHMKIILSNNKYKSFNSSEEIKTELIGNTLSLMVVFKVQSMIEWVFLSLYFAVNLFH